MRDPRVIRAYTLAELIAAVSVVAVLGTLVVQAGMRVYEASSLAVSAANLRSLAAGGMAYLAEHNHTYWRFRQDGVTAVRADGTSVRGTQFWFGFEAAESFRLPEGSRVFDPELGPLGGYVPASMRPDPSFARSADAFKPKYRHGYIGIGYNGVLAGFNQPRREDGGTGPLRYWQLADPSKVVVFATSAQVNTFQRPASASRPMIEEFVLIDQREVSVHFRHGGSAMVAFANGSAGFLPLDESTRDRRFPDANIGRFAPVGSYKYLK